jgi:hypothetical protein
MKHVTRIARAWPVALVLLAGCAASRGQYQPSTGEAAPALEPAGSPNEYAAQLAELQQELQAQLESAAPDSGPSETVSRCETGAELRDRICELARRICELAEKHPQDAELARQCQSATASCGQAGRDVDDTC